MSNLNKVLIIGRLTKDPEKTVTPTGVSVTKFNIAMNNGFGDNQKVVFVEVTSWQKTADFVADFFTKGKEILIDGRLDFDIWEKDGVKRTKLYVTAERVSFVGSKDEKMSSGNSDNVATDNPTPTTDIQEDDIQF